MRSDFFSRFTEFSIDEVMFSAESGTRSHAARQRKSPESEFEYMNSHNGLPRTIKSGRNRTDTTSENEIALSACRHSSPKRLFAYDSESVGMSTNASEPTTAIGRYNSGNAIPIAEPNTYIDCSLLKPVEISRNGTNTAVMYEFMLDDVRVSVIGAEVASNGFISPLGLFSLPPTPKNTPTQHAADTRHDKLIDAAAEVAFAPIVTKSTMHMTMRETCSTSSIALTVRNFLFPHRVPRKAEYTLVSITEGSIIITNVIEVESVNSAEIGVLSTITATHNSREVQHSRISAAEVNEC